MESSNSESAHPDKSLKNSKDSGKGIAAENSLVDPMDSSYTHSFPYDSSSLPTVKRFTLTKYKPNGYQFTHSCQENYNLWENESNDNEEQTIQIRDSSKVREL